MSKNNRRISKAAPVLITVVIILTASWGTAAAQTAVQAREPVRPAEVELAYAWPQAVWSGGAQGGQLPQDIRIMQRIVQTALGEVEAPELPDALAGDEEPVAEPRVVGVGGSDVTLYALAARGNRVYSIGSRDVTGFYMQGYGYLFTVKWRVAPRGNRFLASGLTAERMTELDALVREARRSAARGESTEARAAGEAERALEQERQQLTEQQTAWEEWSAAYRDRLAEALRDVVARYGSTLKRAAPEESITFIADFGGGEAETVTVSAPRGALTGVNPEENLAAVRMAKGETGVSDTLRTELKIMAEIIDSALQVEGGNDVWNVEVVRYFGGDSSYQYVPGYGVLFRKSARLNLATQVIQRVAPSRLDNEVAVQSLRQTMQETTEEQREAYAQHLEDLKQRTAEILATYGPTLTEMGGDEWVGIYYDVGSAAGLLEGGITNFLVQARMEDIRQAGAQAEGATWLLDRLVTNEKQD